MMAVLSVVCSIFFIQNIAGKHTMHVRQWVKTLQLCGTVKHDQIQEQNRA